MLPFSAGAQFHRRGVVFDTLNPADKNASIALSNGNLTATGTATGQGAKSVKSQSVGKLYLEVLIVSGSDAGAGLALVNASGARDAPGGDNNSVIYQRNGGIIRAGGVIDNQNPFGNGAIGMVALDLAAGKLWFGINGVWTVGSPAAGTGGYSLLSGAIFYDAYPGAGAHTVNFGATAFSYTVPSGFTAWG